MVTTFILTIYHSLSLSTPDLKLISFTYPFLHSYSDYFWTAFMDLDPVLN